MQMHDPCHPGELLREAMGENVTTAELASHLGMPRESLARILNGRRAVSPAVAIKLGQAFPKQDAAFWLRLQAQHDLWQETLHQKHSKKIKPFRSTRGLPAAA